MLAHVVRLRLLKRRLLGVATRPVLCTLFRKSAHTNWSLGLHRDMQLPLAQAIDHPHWGASHDKQGIPHAQAPRDVLSALCAVRVHVDDADDAHGALDVVPGSHTDPDVSGPVESVPVRAAGALVMRPLVLHGSPAVSGDGERRVLHFLFGPPDLPHGAAWYYG